MADSPSSSGGESGVKKEDKPVNPGASGDVKSQGKGKKRRKSAEKT